MEQPSVLLQVVFLRQCFSWAGSGSTFQLGQVGGAGLLSQPVCCHLVQAATIKQKLSVLHYVVANCSFLALLAAATVTRLGYNYEAFRVLATLVSSMSLSRHSRVRVHYVVLIRNKSLALAFEPCQGRKVAWGSCLFPCCCSEPALRRTGALRAVGLHP